LGKNKLKKFSEMETFQRVFQPPFEDVFGKDHFLKGRWGTEVFCNRQPIVLELGCGKGEYTVGQAEMDPSRNFIGVDIKGARIWRGAKFANEKGLFNVAFLRARIEFIESFFAQGEADEIWITFPDPQLKRRRSKKRLTGPLFLNRYRSFLRDNGIINLKTDNVHLYEYTLTLVRHNMLEVIHETRDLYRAPFLNDTLAIQTYYEKQFLSEGATINYLSFRLPSDRAIEELPDDAAR
jgi:tRNA (guanine-N7-)-methyltransferase